MPLTGSSSPPVSSFPAFALCSWGGRDVRLRASCGVVDCLRADAAGIPLPTWTAAVGRRDTCRRGCSELRCACTLRDLWKRHGGTAALATTQPLQPSRPDKQLKLHRRCLGCPRAPAWTALWAAAPG